MARRSKATEQFRSDVDARWPSRPRGSDGWIGDAAHRSRVSDHNPNRSGVVQAEDVTVTRAQGNELFSLLRSSRDKRIKYVIYNGQMFSSYPARGYAAWAVRPYNGSNPHSTHLHLSVQDSPGLYDDGSSWFENSIRTENDVYVVRFGNKSRDTRVARAQKVVRAAGRAMGWGDLLPRFGEDGYYGQEMADAVDRFNRHMGTPRTGKTGMDVLVLDYCRHALEARR